MPDQLKDRQLITDPSLPDEIRYPSYFKALEDISPEDPMTETERQEAFEKAQNFMMPSADEVLMFWWCCGSSTTYDYYTSNNI